jgi:hypothetical protein
MENNDNNNNDDNDDDNNNSDYNNEEPPPSVPTMSDDNDEMTEDNDSQDNTNNHHHHHLTLSSNDEENLFNDSDFEDDQVLQPSIIDADQDIYITSPNTINIHDLKQSYSSDDVENSQTSPRSTSDYNPTLLNTTNESLLQLDSSSSSSDNNNNNSSSFESSQVVIQQQQQPTTKIQLQEQQQQPPPPPSSPPPDDEYTELWMFEEDDDDSQFNNDDDDDDGDVFNPFGGSNNNNDTSVESGKGSTYNNNNNKLSRNNNTIGSGVISGSTWTEGNEFSSSLFRLKPRDTDGNLILVLIPTLVKRTLVDLQLDIRESRFGEFLIKTLNSATFDGPRYNLIIISGEDSSNPNTNTTITRSDLVYMTEIYSTLEVKIRKAVQHVYVIHPSPLVQSGLWLLRRFISNTFWRKLVFIKKINDVPNMDISVLKESLPEWVISSDVNEEKRRSLARPTATSTGSRPTLLVNFSSYWRVAPQFVGAYLWEQVDKSPFGLPSFVVRCVTYLCLHGIKVEGLFRESANKEKVVYSKNMLSSGQDVDFGGYWSPTGRPATQEDVHVVAALLKMYFRDSPLCILGHAGFSAVMKFASRSDISTPELIESFRKIMSIIATPNRNLLQFLLLFLSYMVQYERINRMTSTAMSVCWGPNLIRDESDQTSAGDFLMAMGTVHRIAHILIEHVMEIFPCDETTIYPPCYSSETGEPLPLDEVLVYDVTRAASSPSLVERREFDDMLAAQVKSASKLDDGNFLLLLNGSNNVGNNGETFVGSNSNNNGGPTSLEEIETISIRDLKLWLIRNQFDVSICKEKQDLIHMARNCFLGGRKSSISSSSGNNNNNRSRTNSLASGGGGGGGNSIQAPLVTTTTTTMTMTGGSQSGNNNNTNSTPTNNNSISLDSGGGGGSIFRSMTATNTTTDFDLVFDEQQSLFQPVLLVDGTIDGNHHTHNNNNHHHNKKLGGNISLTKHKKDLLTSCRGMKMKYPVGNDFLMDEDRLIDIDAQELRNTALFGSLEQTIAAQQGVEIDFTGMKRWSLKDISTMATSELKRLIEAHGHDYKDCKGVSALRERARECLLGGPPVF